jgi:hypothetical protein
LATIARDVRGVRTRRATSARHLSAVGLSFCGAWTACGTLETWSPALLPRFRAAGTSFCAVGWACAAQIRAQSTSRSSFRRRAPPVRRRESTNQAPAPVLAWCSEEPEPATRCPFQKKCPPILKVRTRRVPPPNRAVFRGQSLPPMLRPPRLRGRSLPPMSRPPRLRGRSLPPDSEASRYRGE